MAPPLAGGDELLCYHFQSLLDLLYFVEFSFICKGIQSLSVVDPLGLREAALDAVELRAVADVQDLGDVQPAIQVSHVVFVRVNLELVHENRKASLPVLLP